MATRYVSPTGNDSDPGTSGQPWATLGKFFNTSTGLQNGDTGILLGGTFTGTNNVDMNTTITIGVPNLTVRNATDESVQINGRIFWDDPASGCSLTGQYDNTGLCLLRLNGNHTVAAQSTTSWVVWGDNVVLDKLDMWNDNTRIGFNAGLENGHRADGLILRRSRIHHCGVLPAANHQHCIYLDSGTNMLVENCVIYEAADRGVMFFPDALDSTVRHCVIDRCGTGVLFAGASELAGPQSAKRNTVHNCVVTNSQSRYNVEASWTQGAPVPTGADLNHFRDSLAWNAPFREPGQDGIYTGDGGFDTENIIAADPVYVDQSNRNYNFGVGSQAAALFTGSDMPPPPPSVRSATTYRAAVQVPTGLVSHWRLGLGDS